MRKGSCVIYLSSTWHGSGQNTTAVDRLGLNVDYNCSLVKSEENRKLLSNPPAPSARRCDAALPLRPPPLAPGRRYHGRPAPAPACPAAPTIGALEPGR